MSVNSQVEMEMQFEQRWEQVNSGRLHPQQAFGNVDEWTIQMGVRKAFLHPELKVWMWFDRLHQNWVSARCGVREGILFTVERMAGMKKLPQPGAAVDDWCIYLQGSKLQGPVQVNHMRHWLENQQLPGTIQIWSPRGTSWMSPANFLALYAPRRA